MGHDGIAPAELLSEVGYDRQEFIVGFESGDAVRAKSLLVATGVVDELPRHTPCSATLLQGAAANHRPARAACTTQRRGRR